MARIRTIKPEFWVSEQITDCQPLTRLLFIGLWNFVDDYGRAPVSPKTLKNQIFPGDDFSGSDILDMLKELNARGLILFYSADDKEYFEITGWGKHQKIDNPSKYKVCPAPYVEQSQVLAIPSEESQSIGLEGKGGERKEDIRTVAKATRPRDDDFEDFWKAMPKRDGANPKEPARKLFLQAVKAGTDPQDIINGARQCAVAERKNINTPYIPQAVKWLRDKRWEDYAPPQTVFENVHSLGVLVKTGTEAWDAWQAHLKASTGKGSPISSREDGWRFDTEYPPGYVRRTFTNETITPKLQRA